MANKSITIKNYVIRKALSFLGLIDSGVDPREKAERLTFVNDISEIKKNRLREYNVWYSGDGDELLNFYTRTQSIEYNYDPLYNRNKKSYFWAVSATESDIKRTHSGQPRNIVDTLVNIIGLPKCGVGDVSDTSASLLSDVSKRLSKILSDNNFDKVLLQRLRPKTLVEGWNAWKINYDKKFRDTPILLTYNAGAVDFVFKANQLVAIMYRDFYTDEKGNNYCLIETRRNGCHKLTIEKELFKLTQSEVMIPVKLTEVEQLRDTIPVLEIDNYDGFLGGPFIYYEDTSEELYGRSIFTGKIDLFDDLDQCLSQSANTVRRSTTHEYFNSLYLEKDQHTGMPIMPRDFDRKYVMFRGMTNGDGLAGGITPVQVTQPNVHFDQYEMEAQALLIQIINGIMSPATLGIDIAKKDNAEAQREKEKVTIFTRNTIIREEEKYIRAMCNELLMADELMNTGKITCHNYDVFVKYDEFADSSFESKLEVLTTAYNNGIMSPELFIETLYKDSLSKEAKKKELDYILELEKKEEEKQAVPEEMGDFGMLGADNPYNEQMKKVDTQEMLEDVE